MSKWAERLAEFTRAKNSGRTPSEPLTKLTKEAFDGFGSASIGGFGENAMPPTAMLEDLAERAAIIGEHADTPDAWDDTRERISRIPPVEPLTKLTKEAFDGFGSASIGGFGENAPPLEDQHKHGAEHWTARLVTCASCSNFRPSERNPDAGMGTCSLSAWPWSRTTEWPERPHGFPPYARAPRYCRQWTP